jgi:hypothetical protein
MLSALRFQSITSKTDLFCRVWRVLFLEHFFHVETSWLLLLLLYFSMSQIKNYTTFILIQQKAKNAQSKY